MSDLVRKKAKIVEIKGSTLVMEICTHEACAACAAKGLCAEDSESNAKFLELHSDGIERQVGDEVVLQISSTIGLKGAFWAYGVPVILLLASVILLQNLMVNQMTMGLITIVILMLYFCLLWLCRNRIEKQISITIE